MKNVIVTGATGFIGSWLVEQLCNDNINVYILVRNEQKAELMFENKNINIIEADLSNLDNLDVHFPQIDVLYHLAWEGVSTELKDNIDLQLRNVRNSIEVIKFAKKINCKKFIATGTVAEYVFCDDVMDVYAKQTPNDIYGASKVAVHYYLDVLSRELKQDFIWAILPSTYGERRDDVNIITYTIRQLLKGELPEYGHLEQMWDFLYVSDVVTALEKIGEYGITGKIYGIGSGIYKPLKDYIVKIRDIINPQLPLKIGVRTDMSEKTFSSCVNIEELVKDTGFVPQVNFEEGIKRTIKYIRSQLEKGIC